MFALRPHCVCHARALCCVGGQPSPDGQHRYQARQTAISAQDSIMHACQRCRQCVMISVPDRAKLASSLHQRSRPSHLRARERGTLAAAARRRHLHVAGRRQAVAGRADADDAERQPAVVHLQAKSITFNAVVIPILNNLDHSHLCWFPCNMITAPPMQPDKMFGHTVQLTFPAPAHPREPEI